VVIAMGKKKQPKLADDVKAEHSEVIKQCVVYLQSKAAWLAGFEGDTTGDSTFAGSGKGELGRRHLHKADRTLRRLVGLSSAYMPGRPALTQAELKAKAIVCRVMEQQADTDLTRDERTYVRFFVKEVEDYLSRTANEAPADHTECGTGSGLRLTREG